MILLGAALVLSLAGVGAVSAAGEITKNSEQSSDFTVTYSIGESYTITVPTDVTLGITQDNKTTFSVDSATLGTGSYLVVKITSANEWQMKLDEDNVIPYTMKCNTVAVELNEDGSVTIYETDESVIEPDSMDLSFEITEPGNLPTKAGKYTDKLTFTVIHTPAPTNPPAQ